MYNEISKKIIELDHLIKEKRLFLYWRYKEYFEKTDGYCKSSEMYTSWKIIINNKQYILLEYKNYFDIDGEINILNEIPTIDLSWLDNVNFDRIDKIKFLKHQSIKILHLLWYNEDQIIMSLQNYIEKETNGEYYWLDENNEIIRFEDLLSSEQENIRLYIENEFYTEYIKSIIKNSLFYIQYNNIQDYQNINLDTEIVNKQNIFNKINEILNINKLIYSHIKKIDNIHYYIFIYSYVFWPHRWHDFNWSTLHTLNDKIVSDFENKWDFEIIWDDDYE